MWVLLQETVIEKYSVVMGQNSYYCLFLLSSAHPVDLYQTDNVILNTEFKFLNTI